jgi:hypothetical protein
MKEEESIKSVLRRLSNLETHILNLVIPLSQLSDILTNTHRLDNLCKLLQEPVKIDDKKLTGLMSDFKKIYSNFSQDLDKIDLSQTYGEIKYIGNRLNNIEKEIKELKKDKKKQKFRLNLEIDEENINVISEPQEEKKPIEQCKKKYRSIKKNSLK